MAKILSVGKKQADFEETAIVQCAHCDCLFMAPRTEFIHVDSYDDDNFDYIPCPQCKQTVIIHEGYGWIWCRK